LELTALGEQPTGAEYERGCLPGARTVTVPGAVRYATVAFAPAPTATDCASANRWR
jgi:hypothetical protein